jgi:hypothetical protein
MRKTPDWEPFYAVADKDWPLRDKIAAYAAIARERMELERFEEFCALHLPHLDQVALDFFGTDLAREAVRKKVEALFPPHEVNAFTDLFFNRIQHWRGHQK